MGLIESEKEILDLCAKISRLAVKVTLEKRYHVFLEFCPKEKSLKIESIHAAQIFYPKVRRKCVFKYQTCLDEIDVVDSLKITVKKLNLLLIDR